MSKNSKKILLLCFVIFVLFGLPVIATITATRIYEEYHIKEMKEYDVWRVHELMKEYSYCPYCGEKLEGTK